MKKQYDSGMISKMFFRLLPVQILLVAIGSLNSIIDGAVASNFIGPQAMAVTGLFVPMDRIFETINIVMLGGSQILCGQFLGRNQVDRTRNIFTVDMIVILAVSMVGALLCLLIPGTLASFVRAEGNLVAGFCDFARGRAFGIPAFMLSSQLTAFLQLEQQEKRTYIGIGVMLVSNCLMDILLVSVFGMGIFGLGLATSISNWLYTIFLMTYYFTDKAIIRFERKGADMKDLPEIVKIGFPGAINQGCQIIRGIVLNALMLKYAGSDGLSAYAAINTFGGIFFAVTAGVSAASRLLISVYTGEEDRTGLLLIVKTALYKGVTLVLASAVLISALSVPLTMIFYRDTASAVYQMTKWGFIIFPYSMPLSCICLVLQSFHQCFKRMRFVSGFAVVDGVVGMCGFALILAPLTGMMGIWYAQVLNGVLTVLMLFIYAAVRNRKWPVTVEKLLVMPDDFGVPEEDRMDLSIHSMAEVVNTSVSISEFCKAHGITGKRALLASLAMEEMAGNVVEHGCNDGKTHHIDVRVVNREDGLLLRLKDDCRPFDPRERAAIFNPEDVTKNIGVRMITGLAKDISYQNMLGLNVLTILI